MSSLAKGAFSVPATLRAAHPDTPNSPVCPTRDDLIRAAANYRPRLSRYAIGMYVLLISAPDVLGESFTVGDLLDPEAVDLAAHRRRMEAALIELLVAGFIATVTS